MELYGPKIPVSKSIRSLVGRNRKASPVDQVKISCEMHSFYIAGLVIVNEASNPGPAPAATLPTTTPDWRNVPPAELRRWAAERDQREAIERAAQEGRTLVVLGAATPSIRVSTVEPSGVQTIVPNLVRQTTIAVCFCWGIKVMEIMCVGAN
jgi:hypothetical protein